MSIKDSAAKAQENTAVLRCLFSVDAACVIGNLWNPPNHTRSRGALLSMVAQWLITERPICRSEILSLSIPFELTVILKFDCQSLYWRKTSDKSEIQTLNEEENLKWKSFLPKSAKLVVSILNLLFSIWSNYSEAGNQPVIQCTAIMPEKSSAISGLFMVVIILFRSFMATSGYRFIPKCKTCNTNLVSK